MSDMMVFGFIFLVFFTAFFGVIALAAFLFEGLKPWTDEEIEKAYRKREND